MTDQTPYLTAEMVEPHLDWMRLTDALLEGHKRPRPDLGDQFLYRNDDTLLSRAAWIDGMGVAVKSVTVMPGNPAEGRLAVQGAMLVFSDTTGSVDVVIDSSLITKWKTAGDSLLGARLLARQDSERMLIVGAGAVARSLVDAYRALFPNIRIAIWGRAEAKAEALAREVDADVCRDLEHGVREADIICTATMAKEPLVAGSWLREGQHLDLIGAFTHDMREVDDAALLRARIFVDNRETVIGHIGELKIPIAAGVIAEKDVIGDYYDLVGGMPGRVTPEDITLLKNGGGAHLDLMTGRMLLEAWRQAEAAG